MGGFPWWSIVLMGVGALAIGAVLVNLFSAVGDRPAHASVANECPVGSGDFLRAIAGVTNAAVVPGGTARLLNNGDEYIPAMLESIAGAERSVTFTTYIWKDGELSDRFFDALIEKAREGVSVRVVIDGIGGWRAPRSRIEELREAGGEWEWFHPPRYGHLSRLHKRNHRRAIVIDGRVGYTGGAAVMDKWLGSARSPEEWRDCMVEVRGRLAASLQSAFSQLWAQTRGEFLSGQEFYPVGGGDTEGEEEGEPITRHLNIISSPSGQAHPMRFVFWFTMHCARERIYITNPYFVPDDVLAEVLKAKAAAGVDVRVLVPNEHNDVRVIRWASHSYYEELLAAGIRIYEYQPTMIHQKLMVVDGRWSLVGSMNMDVRSKELNQENALGILDSGFGEELERTFFADVERAEEIDLERWRRRPAWRKLPERFFRLFEEQF